VVAADRAAAAAAVRAARAARRRCRSLRQSPADPGLPQGVRLGCARAGRRRLLGHLPPGRPGRGTRRPRRRTGLADPPVGDTDCGRLRGPVRGGELVHRRGRCSPGPSRRADQEHALRPGNPAARPDRNLRGHPRRGHLRAQLPAPAGGAAAGHPAAAEPDAPAADRRRPHRPEDRPAERRRLAARGRHGARPRRARTRRWPCCW
jgi:hypothetical protein